MSDEDFKLNDETGLGLSRRSFLKLGAATAAVQIAGPRMVAIGGKEVPVYGPGKVPVTLEVNGKKLSADLEPSTTLLDALRDRFNLTGAKRVCDRGECGACTVIMDGRAVYACQTLAIDAQGKKIKTVESLVLQEGAGARGGHVSLEGWKLDPIQQAFVQHDAQQCGFCTPGFVMASKALLDRNPKPTPEQVIQGLSGNYCRCGTYKGLKAALASVASHSAADINKKRGK
ncbi:MAG TPA: (2Fe-2S)-binding protein [Clostridia bacterium]|nr:(2Fe-2S)-binding protein [Clostridia bacterium]